MRKQELASQVVLITGSARRIGAVIARTLHNEGMNIVLHYNQSATEAANLCNELNGIRKDSAITLQANLQDGVMIRELAQKAHMAWGRLNVLVNNASRFYKTTFPEVTEYAWDDLLSSNLKAPFFLAQAVSPFLRASKGSIINLTDVHGQRPMIDYSAYCISKSGLLMMTKVLAKELGPDIRVNAVSPGSVMWPEGENKLTNEQKQQIIENTSLLRAGEPQDIAEAVLFFIRDASYVTGQTLNVDGGRSLNW
jgi:pteridine reductase